MLLALLSVSDVMGQGPTINAVDVGSLELLRNESSLGTMPGSGGNHSGNAQGVDRPECLKFGPCAAET